MSTHKNQMKVWMDAADVEEQKQLAMLAGTTVGTLQQIAGSYRTNGIPVVRSGLATRIERAADTIRRKNKKLPVLVRTDLSPECRDCEFAQRCLKGSAVASDFAVVTE